MKHKAIKTLAAFAATIGAACVWAAENDFQANTADTDGNYATSLADNWTAGVPSGDTMLRFMNPVTAYFDTLHDINGLVFGGGDNLEESPVVWKAKDANSGITTTKNLLLADSGTQKSYLQVDSGFYHFNDIYLGGTGKAKLVVNGGRLEAAYWMPVGDKANGKAEVVVNGGEIVIGYRDGAAQSTDSRLNIAPAANAEATFTQNGGTVSSAANGQNNAGYGAFVLGAGQNAKATYNLEGGTYNVRNGDIWIGHAAGGVGTLNIDGGTFNSASANYNYIGNAAGSTGIVNVVSGTASHPSRVLIGNGENSKGEYNAKGGTATFGEYLYLGVGKNSVGEFTASDDASVTLAKDVELGKAEGAVATFKVTGGTVTHTDGGFNLGMASGTTNTIEVSGGQLLMNQRAAGGYFDVGEAANTLNTIKISDEGKLVAAFIHLGQVAGSTNEMYVTGGTLDLASAPATSQSRHLRIGGTWNSSADYAGTKAVYTQTGGTATITDVQVGYDTNAEGELNLGGGTMTVTGSIEMGKEAGTKGDMNITGGEMTVAGHLRYPYNDTADTSVTVGGDGSLTVGEFTIAESGAGSLTIEGNGVFAMTTADSYMGNGGPATVVVKDNGYMKIGTAEAPKWLLFNWLSGGGGSTLTVQDNATLELSSLRLRTANTETECALRLDGGTLKANAASYHLLNESDSYSVYVLSHGAKIDSNGFNVTLSEPLLTDTTSTGGGLTKKGAGSLTLASGNTYTGTTVVNEGTLILPADFTPGALVLGGGTLGGTSYSTWTSLSVTGGTYAYSDISGLTSAESFSIDGGTVYVDATSTTVSNAKSMTVNSGEYVINLDSTTAAGITAGSTIALTGVTLGENGKIRVTGAVYDWTATTNQDGSITLTAAAPADATNLWIGGESGDYSVAVNWKYGVPTAGQTVKITDDVWIWIDANGQGMSGYPMGKLSVASGKTLTLGGKTTSRYPEFLLDSFESEGTLKLQWGGIRNVRGSDLTIKGPLVLAGNSARDAWVSGNNGSTQKVTFDSTASLSIPDAANVGKLFANIVVNCPITGAGKLYLDGAMELYGNNSGFTGTIEKTNKEVKFCAAQSGFSKASATEITGTLWLWFNEGTITFGGNVTMNAQQWARGINVPNTVSDVTLVLGANDGTVNMAGTAYNYSVFVQNGDDWITGSDKVTVKKTGSGTITSRLTNACKINVAEGTWVFAADNTDATISVADGVAVTGSATISVPTCAGSWTVAQTLTKTADAVEEGAEQTYTYSCPVLTLNGTADLSNMTMMLDGTNVLEDAETTIIVFKATTISNWTKQELTIGEDAWVITNGTVTVDETAYNTLVLSKVTETAVTPGETTTVTADDAVAATNMVAIALTDDQTAAGMQASYFKAVATKTNEGSKEWTIDIVLDESVVKPELDTEDSFVISSTQASFKPGNVKKGLYYYTISGTDIGNLSYTANDAYKQATSDNEVITLSATLDSSATVQFYRIGVDYVQPTTGE